jgi:hypothetical protein
MHCIVTPVPPPKPPAQELASLPTLITLSILVGAMLVIIVEVVLMMIIIRCRRRERYQSALASLDMGLYDFHLDGGSGSIGSTHIIGKLTSSLIVL